MFSEQPSQSQLVEFSGPDQKDERRKVMQIRCGVTLRSAFFARFVPISDFEFSVFFAGPLSFPVLGLPTKCTLHISVDRMNDEPENLGAPFTARWRGPCTGMKSRGPIHCSVEGPLHRNG